MTDDYVALAAAAKNHYTRAGSTPTFVQALAMVAWWNRQLHDGLARLAEKGVPPNEETIAEFGDLGDELRGVVFEGDPITTESAAELFRSISRVAIKLNSVGVVPPMSEIAGESLAEAWKEAPGLIAEILGVTASAIGSAAGQAVYGLIKGLGVTTLVVGAAIVAVLFFQRKVLS